MDLPFDPQAVVPEVVRALRAGRSQKALSMRLGFKTNMLYRWESGRRAPRTEQVFALARRVGLDPRQGLRLLHGSATEVADEHPFDTPAFVTAWLVEVCAAFTVTDVAASAGLSRQALGRILRGETSVVFADFLALVQVTTGMAGDLVASLVGEDAVPSMADHFGYVARHRACTVRFPWAPALLLLLDHPRYVALPRHDAAWLAEALGAPVQEVEAAVAELVDTRMIRWEGGHLVRPRPHVHLSTGRAGMETHRVTTRYYADLASRRVEDGRGIMSWFLFRSSEAALREVADTMYGGLRSAFDVAMDSGDERVGLMTVQLIPMDDRPFRLRRETDEA